MNESVTKVFVEQPRLHWVCQIYVAILVVREWYLFIRYIVHDSFDTLQHSESLWHMLQIYIKTTMLSLKVKKYNNFRVCPTFSQDSLVNSFPTWVGNSVCHSCSQSQNLAILLFVPIPNPKIWEHCFSFPFHIQNLKKLYWKFIWGIKQSLCTLFHKFG